MGDPLLPMQFPNMILVAAWVLATSGKGDTLLSIVFVLFFLSFLRVLLTSAGG
jgi:hypothetical protein